MPSAEERRARHRADAACSGTDRSTSPRGSSRRDRPPTAAAPRRRRDQPGAERQAARGGPRQPRGEQRHQAAECHAVPGQHAATTLSAVPSPAGAAHGGEHLVDRNVVRCTARPRWHCALVEADARAGARDRFVVGAPRAVALGARRAEQADDRARRPTPRGAAVRCRPLTTRLACRDSASRSFSVVGRRDHGLSAGVPRPPRRPAARSAAPHVTTLGSPALGRRAAPPARRTAPAASACSARPPRD